MPAGASMIRPATQPSKSAFRQWIPVGFHVVRDLPYLARGSRSQTLDVYLPDKATAPRPLMVWIHGGGWNSGDKSFPPGLGLLLHGYVVASIDYRLSREAVFPAQIYDCKAAIRFLRAHARQFDADPTRIGVWGCSAGGQLAALLGTTNGLKEYEGLEGPLGVSSNVQAVCDWFGPSDFLQWKDLSGSGATVVSQFLGGILSANSMAARFASPAEQAGRCAAVPFLIMHGDRDVVVPARQSQILFERLRKAGAPVTLIVLAHAGHGNGWFKSREDLHRVYDFFDRCFESSPVHILPTTRP
ncbi:MAG TPA: alpha/beta hydrolase [Tepidisphaeraceae bacterium]|nr:alpha/beta hydrolase [Tepidisphaeraceae bacterium]